MAVKPTVSALILDASASGRDILTGVATYLNVMDFGVVADGTTNDATALQAAIDAAIAQKLRLIFPPGQYKITTGLVINGPVEICGSWSGELATGTNLICSGTSKGISITCAERVFIYGMRLTATGGAVNGIVTEYAGSVTSFMHHFVRCRAVSFSGAGFWQSNGELTIWDNCLAFACGTGFLADQTSHSGGASGVNCEWRQCRADSCTGDGFDINTQIGFKLIGCQGLNNTAPNAQIVIRGDTFGGTIDGADTELTSGGPATVGILLSGTRHIVRAHQANFVTTAISASAAYYCEFHTCRYVSCTNGIVYSSTADTYNVIYDPLVVSYDPAPATSRNIRLSTAILREVAVTTLGNDIQGSTPGTNSTWQGANEAIACRCIANRQLIITKLSWVTGGTSAGNYDIGILDASGAVLWTKGSTAFPAPATGVTETVSPSITIASGTVFWIVMATDDATATFRGVLYTSTVESMLSDGSPNFARITTAFPLPTTGSMVLTTLSGRAPKVLIRTD